jgi:organic hydroperoxide reductase OsmC/OhrA
VSEHRAAVRWTFSGEEFAGGRYSREHAWEFDGGVTVPASAAPHNLPAPWANPANVDPAEAFVAAVSSGHMLTFLYLASRAGVEVLRYDDEAVGRMTADERGMSWVSEVELGPRIVYAPGAAPTAELEAAMHRRALEVSYIANSVRTRITVRRPADAHPAA